jgi:hypothetical protein
VEETKEKLEYKAQGSRVIECSKNYQLRETQIPYNAHFSPKKGHTSPENAYFWNDYDVK